MLKLKCYVGVCHSCCKAFLSLFEEDVCPSCGEELDTYLADRISRLEGNDGCPKCGDWRFLHSVWEARVLFRLLPRYKKGEEVGVVQLVETERFCSNRDCGYTAEGEDVEDFPLFTTRNFTLPELFGLPTERVSEIRFPVKREKSGLRLVSVEDTSLYLLIVADPENLDNYKSAKLNPEVIPSYSIRRFLEKLEKNIAVYDKEGNPSFVGEELLESLC